MWKFIETIFILCDMVDVNFSFFLFSLLIIDIFLLNFKLLINLFAFSSWYILWFDRHWFVCCTAFLVAWVICSLDDWSFFLLLVSLFIYFYFYTGHVFTNINYAQLFLCWHIIAFINLCICVCVCICILGFLILWFTNFNIYSFGLG